MRNNPKRPVASVTAARAGVAVLICPSCDIRMTFLSTIQGGVSPVEYWDRYICDRCAAAFEYRRRTRQLRRSS